MTNFSIQDAIYTRCYCEENIYMLCKAINEKTPDLIDNFTVVFISNEDRKVPFWKQKSCKEDGYPVVWDYHVILLFEHESGLKIYDFDTQLNFPSSADVYAIESLRPEIPLPKQFQRFFRMIPATMYLREFASDRSHMINKEGEYHATPPTYDPIQSKQSKMNLDEFISMEDSDSSRYGVVLGTEHFYHLVGLLG
ncbi:hypothetical protein K501DRAFT_258181 [Backusella circina FSU 941]|nr:hypothetical protein K501DRAFT_258181 [Backusella circina FSU 941]